MKQARRTLPRLLRLLALTALLGAGVVHADDYAEVTQLLKVGKAVEALAKVNQRLATAPRDPQLRFLRGVAQTDSGQQADAIATFTQLTQEYPELPEPYNNLAVLYAGQNQLDKARTALEMAIRTNPAYAVAHENLGDIYARLASQAYGKALQLDANSAASLQPKLAVIRQMLSADTAAGKQARAAPSPAPAPAPVAASDAPTQAVVAAVQAWAGAWAAKDLAAYLASYDPSFAPSGRQTRAAWEKERKARIQGNAKIDVQVSDIVVAIQGDKATARFRQAYSTDSSASVSSRKTLKLLNRGGRWAIVGETTDG